VIVIDDPLYRTGSTINFYSPGYMGSKGQLECLNDGYWEGRPVNETFLITCQLMSLEPAVRVNVNK
jgi:hypothetical protein